MKLWLWLFFSRVLTPIKGKKVSEKLYKINLKKKLYKIISTLLQKIKNKSWEIWTNIKQCRSRIWKLMITVVRETRFVRSWSDSKVFRRELLCLKVASGETRVSLSLVIQSFILFIFFRHVCSLYYNPTGDIICCCRHN